MPNHVHMLVESSTVASQWLRALKGFTGYSANGLLGLHGKFWQEESYDHLVRNDDEFDRIRRYIENNPVVAGLAREPEEYPWSSASAGEKPGGGPKGPPYDYAQFIP
jgi:putative transposase